MLMILNPANTSLFEYCLSGVHYSREWMDSEVCLPCETKVRRPIIVMDLLFGDQVCLSVELGDVNERKTSFRVDKERRATVSQRLARWLELWLFAIDRQRNVLIEGGR